MSLRESEIVEKERNSEAFLQYLLDHALCKVLFGGQIVPANVLSHHRLEELDAHARHLAQGNKVEDVHRKYARYEHDQRDYSEQNAIRYRVIIQSLIILFACGIRSAVYQIKSNQIS